MTYCGRGHTARYTPAMTADTAGAPVAGETFVPDSRACWGPCNYGYRSKGTGTFRYGDPILCNRDTSLLRSELADIDTMAGELQAHADGFRGSTGTDDSAIRAHRNAGSKNSPSPAWDLVDELVSVLRGHVVLKRQVAARLGHVSRSTDELCSWLITNLDRYLYDGGIEGAPPPVAKLSEDVHRWHGRLERRTKSATALLHKPLPCPACKKRGLEQERGSVVVKCRECGLIRSIDDYESMAADAADATDGAAQEAAPKRRTKAA